MFFPPHAPPPPPPSPSPPASPQTNPTSQKRPLISNKGDKDKSKAHDSEGDQEDEQKGYLDIERYLSKKNEGSEARIRDVQARKRGEVVRKKTPVSGVVVGPADEGFFVGVGEGKEVEGVGMGKGKGKGGEGGGGGGGSGGGSGGRGKGPEIRVESVD